MGRPTKQATEVTSEVNMKSVIADLRKMFPTGRIELFVNDDEQNSTSITVVDYSKGDKSHCSPDGCSR